MILRKEFKKYLLNPFAAENFFFVVQTNSFSVCVSFNKNSIE